MGIVRKRPNSTPTFQRPCPYRTLSPSNWRSYHASSRWTCESHRCDFELFYSGKKLEKLENCIECNLTAIEWALSKGKEAIAVYVVESLRVILKEANVL
jgi:hypothetical protein